MPPFLWHHNSTKHVFTLSISKRQASVIRHLFLFLRGEKNISFLGCVGVRTNKTVRPNIATTLPRPDPAKAGAKPSHRLVFFPHSTSSRPLACLSSSQTAPAPPPPLAVRLRRRPRLLIRGCRYSPLLTLPFLLLVHLVVLCVRIDLGFFLARIHRALEG